MFWLSTLRQIRHSVLAFSVLRMVLLVSLFVFVLATAIGIYREWDRANEAAHKMAQATVRENLNSISRELWNYDEAGWKADLEGMILTPSIARVELFDNEKKVGDIQGGDDRKVSDIWTVDIPGPDGKKMLGTLRISESRSVVNQQISSLIGTLAVTELAKIVILAVTLLVIVYLRVSRHLDKLAQTVVSLGPTDLDARLALDRPNSPDAVKDELDILVEAVNGFLHDRATEVRKRSALQTELMRSEAKTRELLEQAEQLLAQNKTILNNAVIGIVYLKNRNIVFCNQRFEEIFQYEAGELVGRTTECLYESREIYEDIGRRAYSKVSEGENFGTEVRLKHKDGSVFWGAMSGRALDAARPQGGSIWVYNDISERKAAEEKIKELAFYDQLTALPNRTLLLDRLRHNMAANERSGLHSALFFVDLDRFKTVNDTQGHEMGDRLLKQVAQRLKDCVRAEDTVSRFGGDEFIVLITGLDTIQINAARQAESVGQKMLESLRQVYELDHSKHRVTPSIGVTLFCAEQRDTDALIIQADIAMYRMKESGRNGVCFFDPEMQASILRRVELEIDLRAALPQEQLFLEYQPQFDGDSLTGAEALLRWRHPKRGVVMPDRFIPLAEESGLIVSVGYWVLEQSCKQVLHWQSIAGLERLTVSVNVSVHQFREADFVKQVMRILDTTGVDPSKVKMELTESLFADDMTSVITKMNALKLTGIQLSLDDFGTGFSSLSYLKRFPLDQLKIDKSFVRDVLQDANDAAIAKTIIALGNSLGLGVIAEGVETEEQRDFLIAAGCRQFQGYLFSKPIDPVHFESLAMKSTQSKSE